MECAKEFSSLDLGSLAATTFFAGTACASGIFFIW